MDVLLLRAYSSTAMCLHSRCLAMGLYVTICYLHLHGRPVKGYKALNRQAHNLNNAYMATLS
jgi:hypothetical protein